MDSNCPAGQICSGSVCILQPRYSIYLISNKPQYRCSPYEITVVLQVDNAALTLEILNGAFPNPNNAVVIYKNTTTIIYSLEYLGSPNQNVSFTYTLTSGGTQYQASNFTSLDCTDIYPTNLDIKIPYKNLLSYRRKDTWLPSFTENSMILNIANIDRLIFSQRCLTNPGSSFICSISQDTKNLNIFRLTWKLLPITFYNMSDISFSIFTDLGYTTTINLNNYLTTYLYSSPPIAEIIYSLPQDYTQIAVEGAGKFDTFKYLTFDGGMKAIYPLRSNSSDIISFGFLSTPLTIGIPVYGPTIFFEYTLGTLNKLGSTSTAVTTINYLWNGPSPTAITSSGPNIYQFQVVKNLPIDTYINVFLYHRTIPPYPYGVFSKKTNSYIFLFNCIIQSKTYLLDNATLNYGSKSYSINPVLDSSYTPTVAINNILLTNITIAPLGRMKGILSISISSIYEVTLIEFLDIDNIILFNLIPSNLVSYDGQSTYLYETIIDYSVSNINDNAVTIKIYDIYVSLATFYILPNFPIPSDDYYFNPTNLKSIHFDSNNIDLSTTGKNVTVSIKYDTADSNHSPYFIPIIYLGKDTSTRLKTATRAELDAYRMQWNNLDSSFKYTFYLPSGLFNGTIDYILYLKPYELTSQAIYSLLGSSSILSVFSKNIDEMPPMVSSISATYDQTLLQMVWVISIETYLNPLKSGFIRIASDYDPIGYTKLFTPLDFVSGNNISISCTQIATSLYQVYKIQDLELIDVQGHTSKNKEGFIDPFIRVYEKYGMVTNCTITANSTVDNNDPIINLKTNLLPIEANAINNNYYIQFEGNDTLYLNSRYMPIIYLESQFGETFSVPATLDTSFSSLTVSFSVNITQIPFRFGYGSSYVLLKIFGIVDTSFNHAGFHTYIQVQNNLVSPYINDTSTISSNGGSLTVWGFNFNLSLIAFIDYQDGYKFVNSGAIIVISPSKCIITNVQPTLISFIIKIGTSNELLVTPNVLQTIPSTVQPIQCKGTPICGGPTHGTCIPNQGCLCIYPWSDIDCLSRIVNTTAPEANTNQPDISGNYSTQLPSGQSVTYTSFISVVKLLEFDFKESIVKNISLSNWIYRDNSNSTHTLYTYTTNITVSNSNVSIQVDIYWFTKYEIIQFAGQNIEMNPSTMKYKIYISQYPFKSYLNSLQLIISSKILSSNTENSCSAKEFQDSSPDFQYMKLQIDDHSLYGRFIKRAEIDGYPIAISNTLLDNNFKQLLSTNDENTNNNYDSQSYIGINIPNFRNYALIDPDFSMLIDSRSASDSSNSKCASTIKSGLSREQLIGIIVGSVVGGILITLIFIFVIYKRYLRYNGMILSMKEKLKKINK